MKINYFKGKKITLIGLGLLGRGVGDAKFLAEQGAELIVTDLKTEQQLAKSLEQLKEYEKPAKDRAGISYTLGEHKLEDFRDRDMILKGADVPADSPYILEARKNNIPIEMSTALLLHLLKKNNTPVEVVGVTGTRGKSTVTQLLYDIFKADGRRVYLGGNVKGIATLPLLDVVQAGDTLVLELDSWQLQGFAEHKMSPHVAVFTNFYPDHLDYYEDMDAYWKDKEAIFRHQTKEDIFIIGRSIEERIKDCTGKLVVVGKDDVTESWTIRIPGNHNRENIALAFETSKALGVEKNVIRSAVEAFKGLHGRLEFVREVVGVKIYNDNSSTTPAATLAAIKALGEGKKLILIMGGTDKGLDMSELLSEIPKRCKAVVLLNEEGTKRIKNSVYELNDVEVREGNSPREIVELAMDIAQDGDIVLFSPAFPSFGKHYVNVYDRGEQFMEVVKGL